MMKGCNLERGEARVAPSGAEGKPAVEQRGGVEVIDEEFVVDEVSCAAIGVHLDANRIPMVGFQQVCGIGVFLENRRPARRVRHGKCVAVVAAEARCRVVVAAIAEVVKRPLRFVMPVKGSLAIQKQFKSDRRSQLPPSMTTQARYSTAQGAFKG